MKKRHGMKKNIALFALLILTIIPSAYSIGIGIAPTQINISNAFRGGEYERTITIFNPDENASDYALRAEGEAKDWISFYNINSVPINSVSIGGKENYVALMKVKIPEDAGSQTYNSTVYVESIPKDIKDMQTGVAAKLMATSDIKIQVTGDQIVDGIVTAISVDDTEPNFPVRISTTFQNTGNVVVKPKISVDIMKNNNIINNIINEDTKIKPGLTDTIISEWNTTSSTALGDYNTSIVVSLNDKELKSENLTFKILPTGTLSRRGNLTEIVIDGSPELDTTIKIKGHFKNDGQIDTLAKLSAEVYVDNKLIDDIASDELEVKKGEDAFLISYLKVASPGEYNIKGKVIYSGKSTDIKESSFKTSGKNSIPGFEIMITIISILFVIAMRKYYRK